MEDKMYSNNKCLVRYMGDCFLSDLLSLILMFCILLASPYFISRAWADTPEPQPEPKQQVEVKPKESPQSIEALSIDFSKEPDSSIWSFEGKWSTTVRPGWLTWSGTEANQFVQGRVLPGKGLNLDTYPPPWEMEIRLDLPERTDTYAIGIQGSGRAAEEKEPTLWMQILVSWNGVESKITNNGGFGTDFNPFPFDTSVMAADPIDLILQCLAKGEDNTQWRLIVQSPEDSGRQDSYFDFTAQAVDLLNPWGITIEEREPHGFFGWLGGTAPVSPRTYQVDFIKFSRTLTAVKEVKEQNKEEVKEQNKGDWW